MNHVFSDGQSYSLAFLPESGFTGGVFGLSLRIVNPIFMRDMSGSGFDDSTSNIPLSASPNTLLNLLAELKPDAMIALNRKIEPKGEFDISLWK
jgi:hypothetical protein